MAGVRKPLGNALLMCALLYSVAPVLAQQAATPATPASPAAPAPAATPPAAPAAAPSAAPATAAPAAKPAARKERKAGGTLSESTHKQLQRIHELIAKDKNGEALEKANALMERVSSAYEKAMIAQTLGFIYAHQNNYKGAIKVFEQALLLDALPQQPYEQLLYNVGQLYYADGQTGKAVTKLEQYVAEAVGAVPPEAHVMLASLYAEMKRYAPGLTQIDQALAKAKAPKEQWLQLKLALHYELKQYPQCAEVLVRLISLVPAKQEYWKQYSGVLFELKKHEEALAVLALADRQGLLKTESELKNLTSIYLMLDIPLKAGQVLQSGLDRKILTANEKTLTLLGDAWTLACEYDKAEAALKQAAALSGGGDIYFRLAGVYIEDERWPQALEMLDKAQAKGVKKQGEVAFLSGVAAFESGHPKRAVTYLQKALQYDDSRKNAEQWLEHVRQSQQQAAADATEQAP